MGAGHASDYKPVESPLIVLVEADFTIRNLMTRILVARGFRIKAFGLAHEALAWIERQEGTPDLLITDIEMPGMRGPVLADEVCKRKPGAKILFVSGYSSSSAEELNACANPGEPFLLKPFRPDDLVARVRGILGAG